MYPCLISPKLHHLAKLSVTSLPQVLAVVVICIFLMVMLPNSFHVLKYHPYILFREFFGFCSFSNFYTRPLSHKWLASIRSFSNFHPRPLSDRWLASIFSWAAACLFILTEPFAEQKVLILMRSGSSVFPFTDCALDGNLRTLCAALEPWVALGRGSIHWQ